MSEEITSVETSEVAEPTETQTGEEVQEVAEPVDNEGEVSEEETEDTTEEDSRKTEQDAAFADMRRRAEEAEQRANEAERRANELNAKNDRYSKVLAANGYDGDDADVVALADAYGIEPETLNEILQEEEEVNELKRRNEELEGLVQRTQMEKTEQHILSRLQKEDSSIQNLSELPGKFWQVLASQTDDSPISPEDALYMVRALEKKGTLIPPDSIGRVGEPSADKDFFTSSEVDAMTQEQRVKNHAKIMASMSKW